MKISMFWGFILSAFLVNMALGKVLRQLLIVSSTESVNAENENKSLVRNASTSRQLNPTPNRSKIVEYAYLYAKRSNSEYRTYTFAQNREIDCANFVSQAMKAGGWINVQGFYRSVNSWWYDFSKNYPSESLTWINANYFVKFAVQSKRVKVIDKIADLLPGDIIAVDFDPQNSNGIDHVMLVSKKDKNGLIYLSYHSPNTLNKPFHEFYSEKPNSRFYALSLLYNY